ncbi:alanine racemase [Inquilinus sp. CAU 1745]|uniref:alanine racemase n=1 Tax=Inquilinus sp. CAU 1745 TaxID=3140369 RepID=UPI00325B9116
MTIEPSPGLKGAGAILTIDLGAVATNYRLLREKAAPAECAAVVKADAYGLGMAEVAPALWTAGARRFFVAHLEEAIRLREILAQASIGVLNGLMPGCEDEYRRRGLIPVLNHLGGIEQWREAARAAGTPLSAYVHLDTGMNRLGLGPKETDRLAGSPDLLEGIEVAAWMSHLVSAEEPEASVNEAQRQRFIDALARLPKAKASLANSSGIFLGPGFHFDIARPGCALYGINPAPYGRNPMATTVRLDGHILQVRSIDRPSTVGYGATRQVAKGAKIATIAVGYADGYQRRLSDVGRVWLGDHPAPVVGRVSMDLMTVDVTGLPDSVAHAGATAEIMGPRRTPDEVAEEAGTIGYEILTSLGRRYARRYVGGSPSAEMREP